MHSISQRAINWVRGFMAATALVSCQLSLTAESMPDGIAVVTSRRGDARIDGRQPTLHEQLTLTETQLETSDNADLFMVLSNGVSISLGSDTDVAIKTYTQKPFPTKKESQEYEPSESKLKLTLAKGSLCCAFEHLSPISEARVETPHGELRIHSGKSLILVDEAQTQVNMFTGNATFYFADGDGRIFISNSQSTVIDASSASKADTTSTSGVEQLDEVWHKMAEATDYARTRVFFQGSDEGEVATPRLVLPADFKDNPTARPYHFKQRVKR